VLKVVLDTNVIVSALNFRGKPWQILNLAIERRIELFISPFIIEETEGVLKEKFDWGGEKIREAIQRIKSLAELVHPRLKVSVIAEDEADNRILECAVEGKVAYVVTGDTKHLQPLKEFQGIRILSPAEFLDLRPWLD
jgi:putative PIN family toxin of toxin-antitoxin system